MLASLSVLGLELQTTSDFPYVHGQTWPLSCTRHSSAFPEVSFRTKIFSREEDVFYNLRCTYGVLVYAQIY